MTKAFPWNYKGIDRDAQDAARDAAKRSGKSLSDWLDDAIHEKAEADLRDAQEAKGNDGDRPEEQRRPMARSRGARLSRERGRWRNDAARRDDVRQEHLRRDDDRRESSWRSARFRDAPQETDLNAKAIVDDAAAIFEASEAERKTAQALAGIADLIEGGQENRSSLKHGLSAVIDRLGRIETQIAQQPGPGAARPIRRALARLESRIERLSHEDRTLEFETALQALDQRLADIAERLDQDARERQANAARSAAASRSARERGLRQADVRTRRPLDDAIAEITERQRALEEQSCARSMSSSESGREPSPDVKGFGELQSSIAAISQQIESVRHDAGEQQIAVTQQIEHLRRELEGVSRALSDLAPRASVAAVETALRDLAERVETQRHHGVQENILAPIERLTSELHSIIKELDPSQIVRNLYAEVKMIGDKLADRPVVGGADPAALDDLAQQTREIRDLLTAVAARPLPLEKLEAGLFDLTARIEQVSLAKRPGAAAKDVGELVEAIRSSVAAETSGIFRSFEQRLESLAAKIDAVLARNGGGKRFDEINERIEQMHESLAARIDKGVESYKSADSGQLERLVTTLAKKIDAALDPRAANPALAELGRKIEKLEERLHPPGDDAALAKIDELLARPSHSEEIQELAERIDFVHSELAARIEEGGRARNDGSTAQLAELVVQLANKIDTALDPKADSSALVSLEQQIDKLSERLGRSDENAAALASIERTLDELFTRIEETRDATTQAAELAVRQAAQDILREAVAPGALQGALQKDLADLRNIQDESGHRTHETLAAVHETLERVVDRLAIFEEELDEIRKTPPAPAAAPARSDGGPDRRSAAQAKARLPAEDIEEFLLEPSAGPQRNGAARGPEPRGERSVQADFIAAARRAAQQAAVEAQTAQAQNSKKGVAQQEEAEEVSSPEAGGLGRLGSAMQARKRPLLLGLGALVLLIGAYQVARVAIDAPSRLAPSAHSDAGDVSTPAAAARPDAPAGAGTSGKAPPRMGLGPNDPNPPVGGDANSSAGQNAPAALPPPVVRPPSFLTPPGHATNPRAAPATTGKPGGGAVDLTAVGALNKPSAPGAAAPRDPTAVVRSLAAIGDPAAQHELAVRYLEGRGLVRDPKAAARWFEKAANQGLAPAQYRLGSLYEKGIGVDRDYGQASKWYQRAAERGNARAMHNLAVLFAEGGEDKPDYASAANWFRKAAELGVRDSQYNLAILYARGLGVGQSLDQSYLWFAVSARQGDEDAATKRDEVGSRLGSKELAAVKALVENFRPKQPDAASNEASPPPGGWENVKTPVRPDAKSVGKPKVSTL